MFASCKKQGSNTPSGTSAGLSLSRTDIKMSVLSGISDSVTVTSQVPWKLTVSPSDTSWLQVSTTQGASGNTIVTLTTKALATSSQTSSVTFSAASGSSDSVDLTITRQVYSTGWQTALGGSKRGWANAIAKTSNGQYWVVGNDAGSGGDIPVNHGGYDMVVAKFDVLGNIILVGDLGGTADDIAYGVAATSDGGCIVVGSTASNDISVSSNHGGTDCWVVRFDSHGNVLWKETIGGSLNDVGNGVLVTADGYVIVGSTYSNDGDIKSSYSGGDAWVVKLDLNGNIQWSKTYGGSSADLFNAITATADGGYAVAGLTMSQPSTGNVQGIEKGGTDVWIVKLDASGGIIWQQRFGGSAYDGATSIVATSDGYTVAGYTYSADGDVESNAGGLDAWVIKLALNGVKQWAQTYGTPKNDWAYGLVATDNGGYVLAGYTLNTPSGAGSDLWVWELNSNRKVLWQNIYGGMGYNSGDQGGIVSSDDGGYVIVTGTNGIYGDLSNLRNPLNARPTYSDWWIIKLQ
jgi:hypothetical protein